MELAKTYRIETERLVIRCYQPGDAHMMHAAITGSIEHLRPWVPWARQEPKELEWMVGFIRMFRGQFDLGQDAVYGIFDKTETEQIGGTGLHNRIGKDAREIGYWINVRHANKGYATEAVQALIRVAFDIEQMQRLEIRCDPGNVFSRRIPLRLGFRHEMTLRSNSTDGDGRLVDLMVWALSRREYDLFEADDIPLRAYDFMGQLISS
ncbi:MAG TPA: GNAT family protein [Puia sp.]|uniref:GNAT family N-acetyltransferase n=1 Tax=Puia sp. TaxID=2045100 RepID=UPI002C052133|nr:GNAT family protein [Puia sp.]HVU98184.1 GNAT family protein [Puia sp.]